MEKYRQDDLWSGPAPERERRPDEAPFGSRIAALGLLADLAKRGYVIRLIGDKVNVNPRPDDAMLAALVAVKQAIVTILRARP
jgi:hypothetical protein